MIPLPPDPMMPVTPSRLIFPSAIEENCVIPHIGNKERES